MIELKCSDCGEKLTDDNLFCLYPSIPISEWDHNNVEKSQFLAKRDKAFVCCGKFRMMDDDGNLLSYEIPKIVKLTRWRSSIG